MDPVTVEAEFQRIIRDEELSGTSPASAFRARVVFLVMVTVAVLIGWIGATALIGLTMLALLVAALDVQSLRRTRRDVPDQHTHR